jgi:hypothetical protein
MTFPLDAQSHAEALLELTKADLLEPRETLQSSIPTKDLQDVIIALVDLTTSELALKLAAQSLLDESRFTHEDIKDANTIVKCLVRCLSLHDREFLEHIIWCLLLPDKRKFFLNTRSRCTDHRQNSKLNSESRYLLRNPTCTLQR